VQRAHTSISSSDIMFYITDNLYMTLYNTQLNVFLPGCNYLAC